jgi:hypothetical protein
MDASDDLDVATDVATASVTRASTRTRRETVEAAAYDVVAAALANIHNHAWRPPVQTGPR